MLTTLKNILATHLASELSLAVGDVANQLESPKDAALGDLAFPCFFLAKQWRKAPPAIAQELSKKLSGNLPRGFKEIRPVGGYVNFFFDEKFWAETVLGAIQEKREKIGNQLDIGAGLVAVFDYS